MDNQTSNIKLRVILITFAIPIFFAIGTLISVVTKTHHTNLFSYFVLMVGASIKALFSKRKYITSFIIAQDKLTIHYINPLLKPGVNEFQIGDVEDMEVTRSNWIVEEPAGFNIKVHQNWTTYHITGKKLFKDIEGRIDSLSGLQVK